MVFSNFGAPLYEGFENNIKVENEDGKEDNFKYEFTEIDDEGNLTVKVILPKEDGDEDASEDEMCYIYILNPENSDIGNFKTIFDKLKENDELTMEDFLNKLTVDKDVLEKVKDSEDAKIPINYESLTITYILDQESVKECEESESTTQASTTQASTTQVSTTQASKNNKNNKDKDGGGFKDYKRSEKEDDESDEEDEEDEDEEDTDENEPFVGNRIEGFSGNNNRNSISRNFNMKLLLKSLLFACLFYLLAHGDTKNVLLKVVKIDKAHYLYLATVLFFIIYLILNILV
jgi:hypothetical protein